MRRIFPLLCALAWSPAQADTLGSITFTRADTATLISGGGVSFAWLNDTANAAVTLDQAMTDAPLEDFGFANADSGTVLEYTFPGGIQNVVGNDVVVFDIQYDAGQYSVASDYDGFAAQVGTAGWVNTGVGGNYWYNSTGP